MPIHVGANVKALLQHGNIVAATRRLPAPSIRRSGRRTPPGPGTAPPPRGRSTRARSSPGIDYCAERPSDDYLFLTSGPGLGECLGDCDSDEDCQVRRGGENFPA